MYDDYNEEEVERFGKEGGRFLLLGGIIDTPDLEEVKKFKENVRKSNKFDIIKLNERSESTMFENYELKDLIEEFHDEIDEDIEKALKEMPSQLKEALEEAYKILNEYKTDIKEIPGLFSAVQLLGRLATGKPGLPGKYPYPSKKVKKSMPWEKVQDMLFGGHIRSDDGEIEKSSKENRFPSITNALRAREEAIDEIEEEMEEGSNYDDEDE